MNLHPLGTPASPGNLRRAPFARHALVGMGIALVALLGCGGKAATPAPTNGTGGAASGAGQSGSTGGGPGSGGSPSSTGGAPAGSTGGATATGGAVATGGVAPGLGGGGGNTDAGVAADAAPDAASTGGGAGGRGIGGRGGSAGDGANGGATVRDAGMGAGGARNLRAAMVVIGTGRPTAGDNVMLARMTARGIQTTIFSDAAVTAAAVTGMDLVVISSSAESGPLGARLRDIAIPVLCIENGEYPLMGFTAATLNTDYGQETAQSQVRISVPASPLVGTVTGTVTISSMASDIGWGIPPATALRGATVADNANRFAIFGYAKGDQMVGLVAPARRAAFAIRETLAANLTADGIKLFDALLDWVLM